MSSKTKKQLTQMLGVLVLFVLPMGVLITYADEVGNIFTEKTSTPYAHIEIYNFKNNDYVENQKFIEVDNTIVAGLVHTQKMYTPDIIKRIEHFGKNQNGCVVIRTNDGSAYLSYDFRVSRMTVKENIICIENHMIDLSSITSMCFLIGEDK